MIAKPFRVLRGQVEEPVLIAIILMMVILG